MTQDQPQQRVIDCLVNVHFGETEVQPQFMTRVRDDYFKGPTSMFDPVDMAQLLDEMDQHGVQKAVLMDNLTKPSVTALQSHSHACDNAAGSASSAAMSIGSSRQYAPSCRIAASEAR